MSGSSCAKPGWDRCKLLVLLGLSLRTYHFICDPSVWVDEAALIMNVIGKSFAELLGPLFFAEAAPPLFLWLERAVILTVGESTYALRILPFLASCLAMILMLPLARRVLRPEAVPWAVLLFACSDRLLWHACEAKPYAIDVLVAVVLPYLYHCMRSRSVLGQIALHLVLAPLVILLIYPGCFLYGGLLLVLLADVWRTRSRKAWLAYGLLVSVVFTCFAMLVLGPIRAQRCGPMDDCWVNAFPSWDQPWTVPFWTIRSSVAVADYALRPAGGVMLVFAVMGAVTLWRRGVRSLLILLTAPIALALMASCLHAYPFNGSRVMAYAIPAIVLLIAEGVPSRFVVPALAGSAWAKAGTTNLLAPRRLVRLAVIGLMLAPAGLTVYRLFFPWSRADCAGASAYVMAHRLPSDLVVAGHWEYLYYFRHLGPAFQPAGPMFASRPGQTYPPRDDRRMEAGERMWILTAGATFEEQLESRRSLGKEGWQTLEQRRFRRATVFLLGKPSGVRSQGSGAREGGMEGWKDKGDAFPGFQSSILPPFHLPWR